MLSDIIKSDTGALADVFIGKNFRRSFADDKGKYKNYLVNLVSGGFLYPSDVVTLPKEIIPNDITLKALRYRFSALPIMLRYFTHKNLLKEAKDDLDKINQKLQDVMDKDLKDLQDKKTKLQGDKTNCVQMYSEEAKALAIYKVDEQITATSSNIEKIELLKEDIKNLLNGEKATISPYPQKYDYMLESELRKVLEKKLEAYVGNNKYDIEKICQSLNVSAKKIVIPLIIKRTLQLSSALVCGIACMPFFAVFCQSCAGPDKFHYDMLYFFMHYSLPILLPTAATLFALAGVIYLVQRHYEQSLVKEMENFMEEPRHMDKEELKQQEEKIVVEKNLEGKEPGEGKFNRSSLLSNRTPSASPLRVVLYPNLEVFRSEQAVLSLTT